MIFGIGTDIIEVERMDEKLLRTEGLKAKLFTPAEIAYCESKRFPAQHFAARFAAKEAFLKAMGTGWSGGHDFSEIGITDNLQGQPVLSVHGKVGEFCQSHGIAAMHVSHSHLRNMATAVVVLERRPD